MHGRKVEYITGVIQYGPCQLIIVFFLIVLQVTNRRVNQTLRRRLNFFRSHTTTTTNDLRPFRSPAQCYFCKIIRGEVFIKHPLWIDVSTNVWIHTEG